MNSTSINEPPHEKANVVCIRKQRGFHEKTNVVFEQDQQKLVCTVTEDG